jgi:gamma-glutamyltranspeptidase/glutathione hydrolase
MSGMIVAPQPIAVEAGAQVLRSGGNAVDAAVTCAFVQGVVDPHMCGVGGYMLLTFHAAQGRGVAGAAALDAPALAGSHVTADMWQDRYLRPNPDGWGYFLEGGVNDTGYESICVPGGVRGFATMLSRWGSISWPEALAPAARIADEGFIVDAHLAAGWQGTAKYLEAFSLLDRARGNAEASRIYLKNGHPCTAGERLRNPDLAATLRHLAAHGPDDFYSGDIARRMADDLARNGSHVAPEDFAAYSARDADPLVGTYRNSTVVTSPAPHGGPTLLAILNILEQHELGRMEHNSPEYIHLVAMAMKAAFADRNPYLGDPAFVRVPLEWMLSKERAATWARRIRAGEPIRVSFAASEPPDTTHVTVVDDEGNCVALTHSLGSSSGAITPGLGFFYNNSMINYHPLPGHPNSIAAGKARTTGMAPTIVYRDGRPVLVLGAPGATRIITSVAQVLVNVLDFGMSLTDAVLAPRFDCQGDLIKCQARIPEYVCADVRRRHPVERMSQSHGGLGLVHAIAIHPETGALSGAADAGAGGMALSAG